MISDELKHYGVLGMKWGVRRYQNPDGSLTDRGRKRLEKKDRKWIDTKGKKITSKAYSSSQKEARAIAERHAGSVKYTSRGKISSTYINEYNRSLASLMNQRIGTVTAPSGRVVKYVAKRGEIGVHTALADSSYDMNRVRNGINAAGRIAYKQDYVKKDR